MRRTIFHEDHDAFRGTLRQFVDRTLKEIMKELIGCDLGL